MSVEWHKLGEYIEVCDERNVDLRLGLDAVMGMNLAKDVIPTKANLSGNDLSSFKVVHPGEFIYNPRTHGKRIGLAYNGGSKDFLISWNNAAFRLNTSEIDPLYLYMYFLRDEWDREACYQSWGSSTEVFSWKALCEMEIPVPPLTEQKKAVEAWQGLRKMKEQNEQLAEPLLALCRSYLQECKRKYEMVELGGYIEERNLRNKAYEFDAKDLQGVACSQVFIKSIATTLGMDFGNHKIVRRGDFAYSNRINVGSIAYREDEDCIVSPSYTVFYVKDTERLMPQYLSILFTRKEFLRATLFFAFGTIKDDFSYENMARYKIPLPPLEVQQAIVDVYRCANEAKKIAAEADRLSREICPALIRAVGGAGDRPREGAR